MTTVHGDIFVAGPDEPDGRLQETAQRLELIYTARQLFEAGQNPNQFSDIDVTPDLESQTVTFEQSGARHHLRYSATIGRTALGMEITTQEFTYNPRGRLVAQNVYELREDTARLWSEVRREKKVTGGYEPDSHEPTPPEALTPHLMQGLRSNVFDRIALARRPTE